MKVLFVFCEGPHDAHFVGRLLKASNQYRDYQDPLKKYPTPLGSFITNKFKTQNIDSIRIGKQSNPLVPVAAYKKVNEDTIILPISLGGMDKTEEAKTLLQEVRSSFAKDILDRPEIDVSEISILFIYDADSRGVKGTTDLWANRFSEFTADIAPSHSEWSSQPGYRIGLFVFTGADGDKGTLEDNLIDLFRSKNNGLISAAEQLLESHFEDIPAEADEIAHRAKIKKGVLTICGQTERKSAGYALTIVVRDTALLEDVFDFTVQQAQWTKLLRFINGAFV